MHDNRPSLESPSLTASALLAGSLVCVRTIGAPVT